MNDITEYINQARAQGKTDEQIKQSLSNAGWSTEQLSDVFSPILSYEKNTIIPPPSGNAPPSFAPSSFPPAGAWGRFWAITIDSLYILIISYIVFLPLSLITGFSIRSFGQIEQDIKFGLIYLVLNLIYTVYFTVNRGTTFGKDAYGFKVINYNSTNNISYPQALIRESIKTGILFIPIIGSLLYFVNGLIIIFSKQKRGLHDLIAKSQVIKVKQPWSLGKQIIMILFPIIIIIGLLVLSYLQQINPAKQLMQNQQTVQNTNQLNRNPTDSAIDTANWQTYTNSRYKISFIYPPDWTKGDVSDQVNGPANFQISDSQNHSSLNINMSNTATEEMIKNYYSKPTTKELIISGGQAYENVENNIAQIAIRHPSLKDTLIIISFVGNNQILDALINGIKFQQ